MDNISELILQKLDKIDAKVDNLTIKVENLESKVQEIDNRLKIVEVKVQKVESKIQEIDDRFCVYEHQVYERFDILFDAEKMHTETENCIKNILSEQNKILNINSDRIFVLEQKSAI